MQVDPTVCDICKRPKQETNHWFCGVLQGDAVMIYPSAKKTGALGEVDLCGQACVHIYVDNQLQKIREIV